MRRTSVRVLLRLALSITRQSWTVGTAPAIMFGEVVSLSRQAFAPRKLWGLASFPFASVFLCPGLEV